MSYYDTVYTGGDSSEAQWMSVYLYPQSDVQSTCESGGVVATALRDAGDDLVDFGAIDYYEVLRFRIEDYNPPDGIDPTDGTEAEFKEYLDDDGESPDNGTGEDLYTEVGVHQLIHSNQNACDENSEGYAPAGANAEGTGDKQTAFTDGLVAWSPVCSSNDGLTRNAAIQECLHMFIGDAWDDTWTGQYDDQHSLGEVVLFNSTGYVTPMLTYHWDDDDIGDGDCPPDMWFASSHIQGPTECTMKAIRKSADEEIPPQLT